MWREAVETADESGSLELLSLLLKKSLDQPELPRVHLLEVFLHLWPRVLSHASWESEETQSTASDWLQSFISSDVVGVGVALRILGLTLTAEDAIDLHVARQIANLFATDEFFISRIERGFFEPALELWVTQQSRRGAEIIRWGLEDDRFSEFVRELVEELWLAADSAGSTDLRDKLKSLLDSAQC
jgi:hypothetical protein